MSSLYLDLFRISMAPIGLQLFKRNVNYGHDHVLSMCARYSRFIRAAVSTYVYLHHT